MRRVRGVRGCPRGEEAGQERLGQNFQQFCNAERTSKTACTPGALPPRTLQSSTENPQGSRADVVSRRKLSMRFKPPISLVKAAILRGVLGCVVGTNGVQSQHRNANKASSPRTHHPPLWKALSPRGPAETAPASSALLARELMSPHPRQHRARRPRGRCPLQLLISRFVVPHAEFDKVCKVCEHAGCHLTAPRRPTSTAGTL